MKLPLSSRLLACCGFVHPGDRVADIGCDHGYLGIYLLQNGIASAVIAADVNAGPLQCARENALKFGVQDRMQTYLSDGVQQIPRDFDTMVCAGMGADTMISILSAAPWLKDSRYRLILQCQSKRPELRRYLAAGGFSITRETLAQDGKFIYPVTEVVYQPGQTPAPWEYYATKQLLNDNSPLLPQFLRRVIGGLEDSLPGARQKGEDAVCELEEILTHLRETEKELSNGNRL